MHLFNLTYRVGDSFLYPRGFQKDRPNIAQVHTRPKIKLTASIDCHSSLTLQMALIANGVSARITESFRVDNRVRAIAKRLVHFVEGDMRGSGPMTPFTPNGFFLEYRISEPIRVSCMWIHATCMTCQTRMGYLPVKSRMRLFSVPRRQSPVISSGVPGDWRLVEPSG